MGREMGQRETRRLGRREEATTNLQTLDALVGSLTGQVWVATEALPVSVADRRSAAGRAGGLARTRTGRPEARGRGSSWE